MEELRFEDLTMKCDTMMQDEPCHLAMEVCVLKEFLLPGLGDNFDVVIPLHTATGLSRWFETHRIDQHDSLEVLAGSIFVRDPFDAFQEEDIAF